MSAADGTPAEVKVSVAMITYNHERFIAQAIESVLMQETDFPVELVIGEDCSTDGTRAIVQEYAARYPDKIKALLHPHNLGPAHSPGKNNFVSVLRACIGKYVALLEGDDYWTDPYKLQKQVGFLELHNDYVVCCHDVILKDEKGNILKNSMLPSKINLDFSEDELIKGAWVSTRSACFRNMLREMPPEFFRSLNGDTFLFSLLGQFGKSIILKDAIMPSVYRVHKGGVWSQLEEWKQFLESSKTYYWIGKYYKRIGKKQYSRHFALKYQGALLKSLELTQSNPKKIFQVCSQLFLRPTNFVNFKFLFHFFFRVMRHLIKGFL